MHVLDTCKKEEDPFKIEALECPIHFYHYKFIGVLDAQGHLTPQSVVGSG